MEDFYDHDDGIVFNAHKRKDGNIEVYQEDGCTKFLAKENAERFHTWLGKALGKDE